MGNTPGDAARQAAARQVEPATRQAVRKLAETAAQQAVVRLLASAALQGTARPRTEQVGAQKPAPRHGTERALVKHGHALQVHQRVGLRRPRHKAGESRRCNAVRPPGNGGPDERRPLDAAAVWWTSLHGRLCMTVPIFPGQPMRSYGAFAPSLPSMARGHVGFSMLIAAFFMTSTIGETPIRATTVAPHQKNMVTAAHENLRRFPVAHGAGEAAQSVIHVPTVVYWARSAAS